MRKWIFNDEKPPPLIFSTLNKKKKKKFRKVLAKVKNLFHSYTH